ncbi:MAG: HalOD1 output domain-containing protein [Salinigranum sp.]
MNGEPDHRPETAAVSASGSRRTHSYERSPDEPISVAVVEAVTTVADVDPLDAPPLCSAVDPDSLDRLFEDSPSVDVVAFEYLDRRVEIRDGDAVVVIDPDDCAVSG